MNSFACSLLTSHSLVPKYTRLNRHVQNGNGQAHVLPIIRRKHRPIWTYVHVTFTPKHLSFTSTCKKNTFDHRDIEVELKNLNRMSHWQVYTGKNMWSANLKPTLDKIDSQLEKK